ncbi:MAG: nicotinate-nucleotide diphosphorylase (carboxylating), partial [Ichthyobacteriaceae bacterium]|nr:nicotinate-nucleotide diphosphorylase (carboxylating) [Ichthyobacteriaceae bacterium]
MDLQKELDIIIENAIREDVGNGDHSSLASIPAEAQGKAKLLVKEDGIIAGIEAALKVFNYVDNNIKVNTLIKEGTPVKYGDIVFEVEGSSLSILKAERLVLNIMQRMSAVATKTAYFVDLVKGLDTKILDT